MAASSCILTLLLAFCAVEPPESATPCKDDPKPAPSSPPAMASPAGGTAGKIWLGLSIHSSGAHVALGGEGTPWRPFYFCLPLDGLITVDFKVSRPMSFPSGDEAPADSVVPVGPK